MDDRPKVPECEHHWTSRLGPSQIHVRVCTLCTGIDWADIDAQIETLLYHRQSLINRTADHVRHWIRFGNPDYANAGKQVLKDLDLPEEG